MIINNSYEMFSAKQTKQFAGFLAKEILKGRLKRKNALVLALTGNLGAGKTTFVQGFLRAADIKKRITSPTFILIKAYKPKNLSADWRTYKLIYHFDCYRIRKPNEMSGLGLEEILNNPRNIVLIEWPERIKKNLPKNSIWIKFQHGKKENIRKIII